MPLPEPIPEAIPNRHPATTLPPMSFGLHRRRDLDPAGIAVDLDSIPPLPDDLLTNPLAAHLDPRPWFTHPAHPLEIEIGSGKGTFLVQQASLQPATNFLGFEYAREFFDYAADRLRRAAVPNVRLLNTDAAEFLHWRLPNQIASVIHLYFPDPWPKAKHHRRRMIQDRFLLDAHRLLIPGGELRVVTDHPDYWTWMEDHFARFTSPGGSNPLFERWPFAAPPSAREGELVGTNFERKYRAEGRDFHAAILRSRVTI